MDAQQYSKYLRVTALLSSSILGFATVAWGQERVAKAADAEPAVSQGFEEIIVTAQRRTENLQRSSLAMEVISAKALREAGVNQAQDLTSMVPGLQVSQYGPLVQTFIRGVGDFAGNPTATSPVAYNIDGVYIARGEAIGSNFFDLERVEVLKGPQGTLYGRNASGGAVNINTHRPVLGKTEGYATVEAGNLDYWHAEAAINLPVSANLALRGAFNLVRRDGYLSDGTSDINQTAGRIRALWEPSDKVSVLVNFDASHTGGKGGGFTYLPRRPGAGPREGTLDPAAQAYLLSYLPVLTPSVTPFNDGDFRNISAEFTADLGFAKLTLLPAYRYVNYENFAHSGFIVGQAAKSKQTSVEARLSNATDRLKWVAGLYYFREKEDARTTIAASPFIQDIDIYFKPDTKSYAAFGEATVSLSDDLRLIGGLRYTSDRREMDGDTDDHLLGFSRAFSGAETFKKTTWKAGAEYDVGPQNLLFFTASTGFKSGGINQEVAPNVYKPETLTAYELGSRNRFFDNRLQINVELFYWKYKDRQETAITLDNSFFVNLRTQNAAEATIKGGNIDVLAKIGDNGTLHMSAEYNNAKYGHFTYSTVDSAYGLQFFDPNSTGCAIGAPTAGPIGSTKRQIDCSGNRLPRAPEWSGSIGYKHSFPLANGSLIEAGADLQLASWRWLWPTFTSAVRAPGYALLNLDATFTPPSGRWSISGFVRNATNEAVYQGGFTNPYVANFFAATINPPRTYGARLSVNF